MRGARRPETRPVAGPILLFRGEQGDRWRLSALFVLDGPAEPPDLAVDGLRLAAPPRDVAAWRERRLWRFDFAIPRGAPDARIGYGFAHEDRRWFLTLPPPGRPPRIAYVCGSARTDGPGEPARPSRWGHLLARHRSEPFHLLLHGGGHVAGGAVWHEAPSLESWRARPARERLAAPFTAPMEIEARDAHFDRFVQGWRQPEVAALLASTPSILAWDGGDVFPGWGDHPVEEQVSPVFEGLFEVARRHAHWFLLGTDPSDPPDAAWGAGHRTLTQGFRIGDVAVLALDLRTERTDRRMLGDLTWAALDGWLGRFAGCRELLVLSAQPLAFTAEAAPSGIARLLPRLGLGSADRAGGWHAPERSEEAARLVRSLGGFARRTGARVAVVSGDLGFAASGTIRGAGFELHQLVAPPVAEPPAGPGVLASFERAARRPPPLAPDLAVTVEPLDRETGSRAVPGRGWIGLDYAAGALTARWHLESRTEPIERVVPPA